MKLKLVETKFRYYNLDKHYDKHVAKDIFTYLIDIDDQLFDPYTTKEEYDSRADNLSKQLVRTSDVDSEDRYVGYVMKTKDGGRENH